MSNIHDSKYIVHICIRHLNWTLKSLKLCYGRDDEQPLLKSFTPEMNFPQSNLQILLEGLSKADLEKGSELITYE